MTNTSAVSDVRNWNGWLGSAQLIQLNSCLCTSGSHLTRHPLRSREGTGTSTVSVPPLPRNVHELCSTNTPLSRVLGLIAFNVFPLRQRCRMNLPSIFTD